MRNFKILSFLLLILSLISCEKENEKKIKIGFSQLITGDNWRKTMFLEMQREASFHSNIELILADAKGDINIQNNQLNEFIKNEVDLIIICPVEVDSILPALKEARIKKIPVISIDRKIKKNYYNAFVGTENFSVGEAAGNYASIQLNGYGKVLEIGQDSASSPSRDRHLGFLNSIKKYPQISYLGPFWLPINYENYLESLFKVYHPNYVFAHNDRFALDVSKVLEKLSLSNQIKIIGVDGLFGKNEGLDLVNSKKIDATILYPTGGQEAIKIALKILGGEDYSRENNLFSTVVNSENIEIIISQFSKINGLQEDIDKQLNQMESLNNIYISQRNRLYFISSLLVIITALGSLLYYLLREKQYSNRKLEDQNKAILSQKDEIEKVSELAKDAIEEKMRFYSYVSHEFKTPLSLILTPIEDILTRDKLNNNDIISTLKLIQKNGLRLLRLVNQLLEMRQLDAGKMELKLQKKDLILFIKEIVSDFQYKAKVQSVDLVFKSLIPELLVNLDFEKFDKVMFNLLSNAFKYTSSKAYILVELSVNENKIYISVKDNGKGMTLEEKKNAFELFYRGNKNISLGSGLGLALTKEYILLHGGTIEVESEEGQGTVFNIVLPLNQNILNEDMETPKSMRGIEINLLENDPFILRNKNILKDNCIVLVEDNNDLNNFLTKKLLNNYQVISCFDAEKAWDEILENIPDIVISDIMLPGIDGFSLLQKMKADFRTSHIPVILLTAKSNIESEIVGTQLGADAYISKPFNQTLLEERIKVILENRNRSNSIINNPKINKQFVQKGEKRFLLEFERLIEENIKSGSISVEKLSHELGMSRVQLFRKISALTEKNVVDYIAEFRLKMAYKLLQETDLNISEIAYELGFSSPSYFTTFFKHKTNTTPSIWRENLSNKT